MSQATAETCLCMDVRAAANRLTQAYDHALADAGLTVTQFSLLHLIQTLGKPTMRQIAEAGHADRSTLGRNLRVLEKMGLVSIRAGEDARTRTVQVTRKGSNAFKRAIPLWADIQASMKSTIGESGHAQLKDLLHSLQGGSA